MRKIAQPVLPIPMVTVGVLLRRCAALAGCIAVLLVSSASGNAGDAVEVSSTEPIAAAPAVRVPEGFRAAEGTVPEPYTNSGWAKEVVHEKTGIEMVFIPPGEFLMGSPQDEAGRNGDETQHRVILTRPFYLGKYEVTNAEYRRFQPSHDSGERDGETLNRDRQPVADVSWEDARVYCDWAGLWFPTEAQWEYACRAGTTGCFWWGTSVSDGGQHANVGDRALEAAYPDWPDVWPTDDGAVASADVGSYDANAFGLYDMIGNVAEWCQDVLEATYYETSPTTDPQGPKTGWGRVWRGGSWEGLQDAARCARRRSSLQNAGSYRRGFRALYEL